MLTIGDFNSFGVFLGKPCIGLKYFKTLPLFSYSFDRNAFVCMVPRSCSQTTYIIGFSAHKQWHDCSIVPAYKNKSESTKIFITLTIKEDSHYKSNLYHKITMETKQAVFPWEFQMRKI